MPTITSWVPKEGDGLVPEWPCVWCGDLTNIKAETPFRRDLGFLPLHLTCGADLIYVLGHPEAPLDSWMLAGMERLRQLPAHATATPASSDHAADSETYDKAHAEADRARNAER